MMEKWRRNFIIVVGFVESLVFSGCLFGWPSLLLILQEEGTYRHLCTLQTPTGGPNSLINGSPGVHEPQLDETVNPVTNGMSNLSGLRHESQFTHHQNTTANLSDNDLNGCDEQRIQMTLIYTFAAVAYGITAIFIGVALEVVGLRITRLIGSIFACAGFLFLAFSTAEHPNFLWPALILLALGTNQLRLSGFQFANLWPEYKATVLTSYSSAYAISTTFFLGTQLLYEEGLSMHVICLCSAAVCSLTVIPTFFMPSMSIKEPTAEATSEQGEHEEIETEAFIQQSPALQNGDSVSENGTIPERSNGDIRDEDAGTPSPPEQANIDERTSSKEKRKGGGKRLFIASLKNSVLSISGGFHMYWHFINLLLILFYSSTFNIWVSHITDKKDKVSFYIKMSGVCSLLAPIFIPVSGYVTDKMVNRAEKLPNPVERLAYKMQAPTYAMTGATILLIGTMVCKLFFDECAVYLSLILIALSRPSIIGTCTSYIRFRFTADQFNILNGIFTTTISVFCFVQYPIMQWMTSSDQAYSHAHWLLLISLILSLVSPLHMMPKRNIVSYAKTRMEQEMSSVRS